MADPVISYARSRFAPIAEKTIGSAHDVGAFETFDGASETFYAIRIEAFTSSAKMPLHAASVFGSCACETPTPSGSADNYMY